MPKKWDLRLEVGRNLQNFTDLEKAVGWIFKDGFAEEGIPRTYNFHAVFIMAS